MMMNENGKTIEVEESDNFFVFKSHEHQPIKFRIRVLKPDKNASKTSGPHNYLRNNAAKIETLGFELTTVEEVEVFVFALKKAMEKAKELESL